MSQSLPALVDNKRVCWAWRMLVKFFRVYTYLWGTFNLGFTKMTKFYTFGHISQCRWGWRGKTLIKLTRYLVMVPQKKRDQFADPCAGKLIFSRKTLGLIGHMNICWKKNEKISLCDVIAKDVFAEGQKFCDSRILWVKFHICLKIACVKVLTNIMSGPVPTWCKNLCILVHKQMASLHACSSFSALYFLRPT